MSQFLTVSSPRGSCALVVAVIASTGCYFEGSVGYHPSINQRVTPSASGTGQVVTGDSAGWSAAVNIGFYLDVKYGGIGLSPSSFNGYGLAPSKDAVVRTGARGTALRADVVLPFNNLSSYLQESVALTYTFLSDTSATLPPDTESASAKSSDGKLWSLGYGLGYALPVHNGTRKGHFVFRLSAGIERFAGHVATTDGRAVSVASTGFGARFMIVPAFIGTYHKGPYEDFNTSGSGPEKSNAGCYYSNDCDSRGNCTQQYKCM